MGDPERVTASDLAKGWDFLWKSLNNELRRPQSHVNKRLVTLIYDHSERVAMWAKGLAQLEKVANPLEVELGAAFHDCAKLSAQSPSGMLSPKEHMAKGKLMTAKFLKEELGKHPELVDKIAFMVESHDYTKAMIDAKTNGPDSLEEKIVHDANFLDYIDSWGLILTVELCLRHKTIRDAGGISGMLEFGAQQSVRLANELLLPSAQKIAGQNPPGANCLRRRMIRCYRHLHSLNLERLDDLRNAFAGFLFTEDAELAKTLGSYAHLGFKSKIAHV